MDANVQTSQSFDQMVEQPQQQVRGSKLPSESEIVHHFDPRLKAARDTVKHLLKVELAPNKGATAKDNRTTSMTVQVLSDLMIETGLSDGLANLIKLRMILEPGIAAIATETATNGNIEAMQQALATMDAIQDDAKAFISADQAFHLALAKATQNSLVAMLLNLFMNLLQDQSKRTFAVNKDVRRELSHHKRIFDAVIQRSPGAARQAMTDHLKQLLEEAKNT